MIPSFQINHLKLKPGVYVSRYDQCSFGFLTTFDLRICKPNSEMLPPAAAHTIEHIVADYLRNRSKLGKDVVYFGPMGCMTGFYLILKGYWESDGIIVELENVFASCEGTKTIVGSSERECGNAKFHDLEGAMLWISKYLHTLRTITSEQMRYPE